MKLVILLIIIFIVCILSNKTVELFEDFKFFSCNKNTMGPVYDEIFEENNIQFDKNNKNTDLYIPCYYDNAENEINEIFPKNKKQKIHMIKGCDKLVSKLNLWNTMFYYYGFNEAAKYVPYGFSILDKEQRTSFLDYYFQTKNKDKLYIAKSIKQRQEGLLLTRDIKELVDNIKDGFNLVQEFIANPLTIDGYKLDYRIYLLLVCNKNKMEAYIHTDAPIHYGKIPYTEKTVKDINKDALIPSGFIDINLHLNKRPTTLKQLDIWIRKNRDSNYSIYDKSKNVLTKVMDAFKDNLCTDEHLKDHTRFQLFGIDFILKDDLDVRLIEFNKGSDMTYDRPELQKLKQKLVNDMLDKLGIIESKTSNEFMLFWNYTK